MGDYYKQFINKGPKELEGNKIKWKVDEITKDKIEIEIINRMRRGWAFDNIPIEAWWRLGNDGIRWIKRYINKLATSDSIPNAWRKSFLISLCKGKRGYIEERKL